MKLNWQIVRLVLKETFSISYGNYSFREALIVSLNSNHETGYGECILIDYYQINLSEFTQKLEQIQSKIEGRSISHPVEFYSFLESLHLHSFLRSALDCAYWDLFGKLEKKNFLELNFISYHYLPESSLTISIDTIENQINKIRNSLWTNFKIKCNEYNEKSISKLIELDKNIALDANGSFSINDCNLLEKNSLSKKLTYIEQPLKINCFNNLKSNNYANWMADEDCQDEKSIQSLKNHYSTLNLKLVKIGGLTPSLQFIKTAKANNFKVMIGCMTKSTIGISAGAVLTPLVDYVDLDGASLISNDIAQGSFINNGKVILTEKYGLGISI